MKHRGNVFAGMAVGVIGTAVLALAPVGAPSAFAAPNSSSVTLSCGDTLSISWSSNKALSAIEYIVGSGQNVVQSDTFDSPPNTGNEQATVPIVAGRTYTTTVFFRDLRQRVVKALTANQTVSC